MMVGTEFRKQAEAVMLANGWLSTRPPDFQKDLLGRSVLLKFAAGENVYRIGDEVGGIYGLVDGILSISTAPASRPLKLVHIGSIGAWTGEGCFLTRQPRRLELSARVETWMMHLPLDQMDQMAFASPKAVRHFGEILMATVDELVHVVHDLQKLDPHQRIASVLYRMSSGVTTPIPVTQAEIGEMACASRRQVNLVLNDFAERGWIRIGYRSLSVLDMNALRKACVESE